MKIIVTGGSGMIGRCLKDIINDDNEWIFLSSKDCDLRILNEVDNLFNKIKPDRIVHLAANVGGLYKNINNPISMFSDNIKINENILEICNKYDIQKGIFCLSTCIFPSNPSKYPMNESMIHESEPHSSNEGYAYSKRMMELQCRNYNKVYNRNYICLIPVNLYGPYDNFNLKDAHVIPGMIHRLYNSKTNNDEFYMYGEGKALRQFLYSYDFAKMIVEILDTYNENKSIICCNDEISINSLTNKLIDIINIDKHNIKKIDKDEGCLKKTSTNSYFTSLFPDFKYTNIDKGLKYTYDWFVNNYDNLRK